MSLVRHGVDKPRRLLSLGRPERCPVCRHHCGSRRLPDGWRMCNVFELTYQPEPTLLDQFARAWRPFMALRKQTANLLRATWMKANH